jgi:hypothetical protein
VRKFNVGLLFPLVVHGAKEVLTIISVSFSFSSMFGPYSVMNFCWSQGDVYVRAHCVCRPSVLLKYLFGNG